MNTEIHWFRSLFKTIPHTQFCSIVFKHFLAARQILWPTRVLKKSYAFITKHIHYGFVVRHLIRVYEKSGTNIVNKPLRIEAAQINEI